LTDLDLDFNRFSRLSLPSGLSRLAFLHLRANQFTNFTLSADLPALTYLDVSDSPLSSITLSASLSQLTALRLSGNRLTSLALPTGLTNLTQLNLSENQLTNLVLPPDLFQLESLNLGGNQLAGLNLPSGLTNLTGFFVTGNQFTNLTLPPDMTQLTSLGFLGNPLTALILSEIQATNLAEEVDFLRNQGVSVFTYPLSLRLLEPRQIATGGFEVKLTGPPGVYTLLVSSNLGVWTPLATVTNQFGSVVFIDATSNAAPRRFYRALLQSAATSLLFLPAKTGRAANDLPFDAGSIPQADGQRGP
jgi:hypothetical protein